MTTIHNWNGLSLPTDLLFYAAFVGDVEDLTALLLTHPERALETAKGDTALIEAATRRHWPL